MTNVVRLIQADDRKALEVIQSMLAYVHRETGDLKTPQPDLAAAVGSALDLSSTILSEAGDAQDFARRCSRTAPD